MPVPRPLQRNRTSSVANTLLQQGDISNVVLVVVVKSDARCQGIIIIVQMYSNKEQKQNGL
jgi:hypothetical protein